MKKWQKHLLMALTVTGLSGLIAIVTPGNTASANAINTYISNQHYPSPKITKSIWSGFPKNAYRTGKPEGVVVHETANPSSTIYNEIAYMERNYQNAFVHTFVDASSIINIANTNYLCWGAGPIANARFVQFEQIEVHSKSGFASELNNAAYYTAYILKQYGLTPKRDATVLSHHDVSLTLGGTDHTDPDAYWAANAKTYFGTTYTMNDFMVLVTQQFQALSGATTPAPATTTETDTSHQTPAPAPTPTTQAKTVSYYKADANQTAKLSHSYTSYSVYNHVKGTANARKIGWKALTADHRGATVYLDNRGVKRGGWQGTWYRIRFGKNSTTKYWVYSKALTFTPVTYQAVTTKKTLKTTANAPLYNHVLNSSYLAKTTGNTKNFANNPTVQVSNKAVRQSDQSVWYRFTINRQTFWARNTAFMN